MVKLGDICTVVSGSTPSSSVAEYWDGNHIWITPAELSDDSFIIYDSVRHITDRAIQETSLKPFPEGTVILSSCVFIGKTAIAGCKMYCNQGFRACLETSAFIVTRRHVDKKRLCAAAKTREDCQTVPQRSDGQRMGACTSSPAPCFWRRSEAQNRPA